MSKKNLLNESQVRQFMKLASLEPLSPGFINGLTEAGTPEDIDEVRTGADPTPNLQSARRGSGRGRYAEDRLEEEDLEAQDHDLEDAEHDMDHADDLEMDAEEDLGDVEGGDEGLEGGERMISVDGLLAALEGFLEDQLDQEVEIDSSEMDLGDDEEVEVDAELGDAELEMDAEEDIELQEGEPESEKKWGGDKGDDPRRWDPKTKTKRQVKDFDEGKEPESEKKWGGDKGDDPRRWDPKTKTKRQVKDFDESTEAIGDLVEAVTKRVAARILKSALAKK